MIQALHIGVEQALRDLAGQLSLVAQSIQQQNDVQAVDFEASLGRVGRPEIGVQRRLAGLAHRAGVERTPGVAGRPGFEQTLQQHDASISPDPAHKAALQ